MSAPRQRLEVLWEDRWLMAARKPEGLPVIKPEGSRGPCLQDWATDWIRRSNPRGRAAIVHRIDRDSSGLVLLAKDGRTKKALMGNWDEAVTERLYQALVLGRPDADRGVMEDWLKENKAGEVYATGPGAHGSKPARTEWRLLGSGNGLSLLELSLFTGRKHQIRVQLSIRGMPILGDPRYGRPRAREMPSKGGPRRREGDRLYLHAKSLSFRHPFTGELISLDCPPPESFRKALGGR